MLTFPIVMFYYQLGEHAAHTQTITMSVCYRGRVLLVT